MIHSLLAVCLLTMGVGAKASTPIELNRQKTPTHETKNNINYRQTNNSGIVTEYTLATCNTPTGATTNNNITKINFQQESNDAIAVQSIIYITDQGNYASKPTAQWDNSRKALNSIQEIKITPYLATIENTLTLNIMTYVADMIPFAATDNYQVFVRTEILYGQGTLFEQAWDQNNWSNNYALYNTFETLKANNYTSNYAMIDSLLTESNTPQLIRNNVDITIPKDSEDTQTYVYALTYFVVANFSETDQVLLDKTNENDPLIRFYAGGTIKGTALNVTINYEVIDIPSLMWEILSMPFAFISTAFNLTLFAGTPYQLNISNLFMMIFGVLVFIFILKMLLKK